MYMRETLHWLPVIERNAFEIIMLTRDSNIQTGDLCSSLKSAGLAIVAL